jgi:hypothetical protein
MAEGNVQDLLAFEIFDRRRHNYWERIVQFPAMIRRD